MKKILILLANPKDTNKLRLDEELREIQAGLERARKREQFEIISKLAVRPDDLRRALLDHEPQIVHFSGHGTGSTGLALENNSGELQLVSKQALAKLFSLFKNQIECVVLNACYSEEQAEAIHKHINYVVGMRKAIGDNAAIEFAVGFYDGLGAGRSIEDAYEFGCNSIDLEGIPEFLTPVLKARKNDSTLSSESQIQNHLSKTQSNITQAFPARITTGHALENPEGQVPLNSSFYVERPSVESECYETIVKPGALIRVKAPRQMGKTSLMTRILYYGSQQGCRSVSLYFQEADGEVFNSSQQFLQWFCATIAYELNLPDKLTDNWKSILGNKKNCTNYFERYLLSEINSPLLLGLDDVDIVFQHPKIATEFFPLLRVWHERGKNEELWKKLRLVITHSREVYIPLNVEQSPFNVGKDIELPELNQAQVHDLAKQHGLNWTGEPVEQLIAMVSGHPYLVRMALYQIARGRMTLAELLQAAPTEEGIYSEHLRRHWLNLQKNANLVEAIKQIIVMSTPVQIGTAEAFKLHSMGLVKLKGNSVVPLCNLYRQYFLARLRMK